MRHGVGEGAGQPGCYGLQHHHQRPLREGGDQRVGEQVIDVGQGPGHMALGRLDLPQLVDVAIGESHPAVAAETLDHVQVVELDRVEGLPVGRIDVIALKEPLGRDLPVGRRLRLAGLDQLQFGVQEGRQVVQVGQFGGRGLLRHEHDAAAFDGGDRDQAAGVLVQPGKAMLVRHVAQGAVQAVGPGVVGADEGLLPPLAADQLRAPVAAGVAKGADHAIAAPNHQQRRARGLPSQEGARRG